MRSNKEPSFTVIGKAGVPTSLLDAIHRDAQRKYWPVYEGIMSKEQQEEFLNSIEKARERTFQSFDIDSLAMLVPDEPVKPRYHTCDMDIANAYTAWNGPSPRRLRGNIYSRVAGMRHTYLREDSLPINKKLDGFCNGQLSFYTRLFSTLVTFDGGDQPLRMEVGVCADNRFELVHVNKKKVVAAPAYLAYHFPTLRTTIKTWELEILRRTKNKEWKSIIEQIMALGLHFPMSSYHEWLNYDAKKHVIPQSPVKYLYARNQYQFAKKPTNVLNTKFLLFYKPTYKDLATDNYLPYMNRNDLYTMDHPWIINHTDEWLNECLVKGKY